MAPPKNHFIPEPAPFQAQAQRTQFVGIENIHAAEVENKIWVYTVF
jgi:hypothetical protein